jgi:hypothetical protein
VVAIAVILVASVATRGVAGAAVQSFGVSPSSGPPGTVVDVSGTACSPGITLTPEDHVTISSTVLPLATNIPVAADGSWHGSFTVPGNATPGSGLIFAVCVNGLTLNPTTYTPHGFTVTANPPATTTTPGNPLPTTPTTARRTTITPAPTIPGPTGPGGTPTSGSTPGPTGGGNSGGGTGNGGSRRGAGGGPGIGGSTGSTPGVTRGAATSNAATAAGLRDPRLASSTSSRGGSGALWVLWLVLLLLAAGAGALLWWWQHREPGEADPVPDVT